MFCLLFCAICRDQGAPEFDHYVSVFDRCSLKVLVFLPGDMFISIILDLLQLTWLRGEDEQKLLAGVADGCTKLEAHVGPEGQQAEVRETEQSIADIL